MKLMSHLLFSQLSAPSPKKLEMIPKRRSVLRRIPSSISCHLMHIGPDVNESHTQSDDKRVKSQRNGFHPSHRTAGQVMTGTVLGKFNFYFFFQVFSISTEAIGSSLKKAGG